MTQTNDNFTPRRVDKQIEQLSPGADQSGQEEKASKRLVRHLRAHYQREAAEQRQRSLENAWERIRQHAALATDKTAPTVQSEAPADPQREREDTSVLWQPQRERDDLRLTLPNRGAASMTRKQIRGLAAFVTIAAVVGLFALLLHAFLPAHKGANPASSGTPQATASPIPTTPPGRWAKVPGLSNIEQASLMIAPSNPQVVYEDLTPAGTTQFSLRRSDDGGATWH
ncbi:MAG TPA: hypothetical protein VFU69_10765, partial [Ktedonobacterales bacterium]|nr:hypothetical protein [Ktedonobacterales bacterium]